jgi:hypothetical protein
VSVRSVDFLVYSDVSPPRLLQGVSFRSMRLSIFRVLSVHPFLYFSEGEPFFFICLHPVFSLLYFSVTQLLVEKLRSYTSDVLSLFFCIHFGFTNPLSATILYIR